MARIRVNVLGPVEVEVDGRVTRLSPRALRVLMRLLVAEGRIVGVSQLRWDLWGEVDRPRAARNGRNQVQKCVFELRRALDPDGSGAVDRILRTERLFGGRGAETGYRLVLDADSLDAAQFGALLGEALHGPVASAADQLSQAIALWRGRPLAEVGVDEFSGPLVRTWQEQYRTALRELVRIHRELRRVDLALPVAERIAADFPDDPDAAADLASVRDHLRARHGDQILRRDFPELGTSVAIVRGDLFDQYDANLVVGFTDTFDVQTKQNLIISRTSMQGQLVERLYDGNVTALDRELRRGLRSVAPAGRETSRSKPRGKRIRYPIGTVVAVPIDNRRVFATAYSRLGNDLVARSRPEDLATALDQVWASVALFGQLAPVAVPLVGSGLSRLTELGPEQVISMMVLSFLRGCREHGTVAGQLRIVLRPVDLERTDLVLVAKAIAAVQLVAP